MTTDLPTTPTLGDLIDRFAPPAPVLDLKPALQRKRQSQCPHDAVEVDDTEASLTCTDCGAELDPWWYLRALARRGEEAAAYRTARIEAFEAWERSATARLTHMENEIARLTDTRNRLWNEPIHGKPLGSLASPRRRRPRKATSL